MSNAIYAIFFGSMFGLAIWQGMSLVPVKFYRGIHSIIGGGFLLWIVILAIPASMNWRVHNMPYVSTSEEQDYVKASDEMIKTLSDLQKKIRMLYASPSVPAEGQKQIEIGKSNG